MVSEIMFIKLGEAGIAENNCIGNGQAYLSYKHVPHDLCVSGKWDEVYEVLKENRDTKGAATRDLNQIKAFYEKQEDVIWITFVSDRLYWCHLRPGVEAGKNGTKLRNTVSGWSDKNTNGELLLKNKLSGKVLATQGFRGTICKIKDDEKEYLLRKINSEVSPNEKNARAANEKLQVSLIDIIKNLNDKDFEILIDLLFSRLGWRRTGVLGGTEKDIDLDLISLMGDQRIAVQVKSRANAKIYNQYKSKYAGMLGYTTFYFVTHSPQKDLIEVTEKESESDFNYWGPEKISDYAIKSGLIDWLIDKAN